MKEEQDFISQQAAHFVVRWIIGLIFVMAGYYKVFVMTPAGHTAQFFTTPFADYWIPTFLLQFLGYTIPFFELLAGLLLCVGFRTREALIGLGLLLIVTTYGHTLQEGLFDISKWTFTRLILILFLLVGPVNGDMFTVDYWLKGRAKPA